MNELAFALTALGLLLLNGLLVACEISLVKLRYSLMEDGELEALKKRRRIAVLLNRADLASSIIRFWIICTNIALGLALYPIFVQVGQGVFDAEGPSNRIISGLFSIGVATCVSYVFGDLVPRGIGSLHPIGSIRWTSFVVTLFIRIAAPLHTVLVSFTHLLFRCFGSRFRRDINLLDVEVQLRALGAEEEGMTALTRMILRNGLRLRELEVSDIILPRNQVQYFDLEDPVADNIELARQAGHTRFPLCEGDLDNCIGIIHIKDIFRSKSDPNSLNLRMMRRKVIRLSNDEKVESALTKLLQHNIHMALAVDDFGGVVGVVTLEKILEQLVGDIQDEFDAAEEELVSSISEGDYKVDGLTPIHDLEEKLQVEIKNDEVSTFGGLITAELGRLPEAGESVHLADPGLAVRIDEVDERRILSATVRVLPKEEDHED